MNTEETTTPPVVLSTDLLCTSNLKALREACGYSLQQLGDLCGRSKAHVWELEKPDANPTLKTAYAISKVLGVDVTDIWPNTVETIEETIIVRRVVHNAPLIGALAHPNRADGYLAGTTGDSNAT